MDIDLKELMGMALALFLSFTGIIVATFRNLNNKISKNTADVHKKIDTNVAERNAKIDNVKEKYVRRDDLNGHIERLDRGIHDLRDEMREQNDKILAAIIKNNG